MQTKKLKTFKPSHTQQTSVFALIMGMMSVAYQMGNPLLALMCASPLLLATSANAQSLPAVIDLNAPLTMNNIHLLLGNVALDGAGRSVSGAADINGDMMQEIFVGSYNASPENRSHAGEVNIELGSKTLSDVIQFDNATSSRSVKVIGKEAGDNAGIVVIGVDDVNDDGIDDFVVTANLADPDGRIDAGEAFLCFGNENLPYQIDLNNIVNMQCVRLKGAAPGDNAGISAAAIGDVNIDGIPDLALGAYLADPAGRINAGNAYILFGRNDWPAEIDLATLTPEQGVIIEGGAAGDFAGITVGGGCDVSGDGRGDVFVTSIYADPLGRDAAGTVSVLLGRKNMPAKINLGNMTAEDGFTIYGALAKDSIGWSLACAGDVNGDKIDDLVIGCNVASPDGLTNAGIVYLIYGGKKIPLVIDLATLTALQGVIIKGEAAGDNAGFAVIGMDDANEDGYADFALSAHTATAAGRIHAGKIYIVSGAEDLPATIYLSNATSLQVMRVLGANAEDNAGVSLGKVRNVTGDGSTAMIIGAFGVKPAGAAYVMPFPRRNPTTSARAAVSTSSQSQTRSTTTKTANASTLFSTNATTVSTMPAATPTANNIIPIIAGAIGGACLLLSAAAVGLFACRRKSQSTHAGNQPVNQAGTSLANLSVGHYQQVSALASNNNYAFTSEAVKYDSSLPAQSEDQAVVYEAWDNSLR